MKLRTALQTMLAGWEEDLSAAWRGAIGGVQLNWKSPVLDEEMLRGEIILPGRRAGEVPGAPDGANPLRTFQKTDPAKVRAVILGQDPYANPMWATGRAFEQGNLTEWPDDQQKIAVSLRRIVQVLAAARTGDRAYTAGDRGWKQLTGDLRAGRLRLEPPRRLFDRLEKEGVLFLNTSLTISVVEREPKKRRAHFPVWAPLIDSVLKLIAARQSGHAIFLLLGRHASNTFDRSRAKTEAERAGTWKSTVDAVRHWHPAAITAKGPVFFEQPNPFCAANDLLRNLGAAPISW
ncbi:MAG TPA: uracil-DNA glycosylase family protein [Bryobacteraceae bacterium]|nr:uracil-DNA glycosylase family protein [Bryobacteraceae bacterium]